VAKLVLEFGGSVLKEVPLAEELITVGRSPQSTIFIDNPGVSFNHARVFLYEGNYYAEDLGSTNGTFVNGKRITQTVLHGGDTIEIGTHTLRFLRPMDQQAVPQAATPAPTPAGPAAQKLDGTMLLDTKRRKELQEKLAAVRGAVAPAPQAKKVGKLVVLRGRTTEKEYLLTSQTALVGKAEASTVRLKGWFAPKVCAIINKHGESYFVTPAGKPVAVNGQPLTGRHELKDGDVVSAGRVQMRFTLVSW